MIDTDNISITSEMISGICLKTNQVERREVWENKKWRWAKELAVINSRTHARTHTHACAHTQNALYFSLLLHLFELDRKKKYKGTEKGAGKKEGGDPDKYAYCINQSHKIFLGKRRLQVGKKLRSPGLNHPWWVVLLTVAGQAVTGGLSRVC